MSAPTTTEQPLRDPTDLDEVRSAARRGRWGRRAAVIGGLVVVAAGAVWVIGFSPLLAVDQITVKGTTTLPTDEVIAAAGVPRGTPLARVDDGAVADRIRALPRVGSVEVRRGFPHELVLVVDERIAVAVIRTDHGWVTLDAAGNEISGVRKPGTRAVVATSTDVGRVTALTVLQSLPASLRAQIARITASTADDVTFTLRNGAAVRWGDVNRADRKAAVLAALMARPASLYDVAAPDVPTTQK